MSIEKEIYLGSHTGASFYLVGDTDTDILVGKKAETINQVEKNDSSFST